MLCWQLLLPPWLYGLCVTLHRCLELLDPIIILIFGSRPSDHYFRSVCWFVCLFVCAEFFSAVFDPISIKLGHMLYVLV